MLLDHHSADYHLVLLRRRLGGLRMRLQQWRLWLQQRLRLLSIQSAPHPYGCGASFSLNAGLPKVLEQPVLWSETVDNRVKRR